MVKIDGDPAQLRPAALAWIMLLLPTFFVLGLI